LKRTLTTQVSYVGVWHFLMEKDMKVQEKKIHLTICKVHKKNKYYIYPPTV